MKFLPLSLNGAFLIELERIADERGSFTRAWCRDVFEQKGLCGKWEQLNVSRSEVKGTVRGLHGQAVPHAETKLVRCTRGAVFDVIVDVRPESPTYLKWVGTKLTAKDGKAMYVPEGFLHGIQSLENNVELFYQTSTAYAPDSEFGARFDDPAFNIRWPKPVTRISEKDLGWPAYKI